VAEPAVERIAASSRAVGQLPAQRFHGAGLEGRPGDPAAPDVDGLVGPRPADRCDAQARSEGRVDAGVDEGEIPAGDELCDPRLRLDAALEADGEPAESGDVLGGDDPDLAACDSDHGAGSDAVSLGSVRHDDDGTVAGAAQRLGAGGERVGEHERGRAGCGSRAGTKALDGRDAHTRRIVPGP